MKATRVFLPLLFLGLLFPGTVLAEQGGKYNSAQLISEKSVPGIQQTAQWKSMKQYVTFLQSQQSTPASAEQKQTFAETLTARQVATNNRVKLLYSQSIQKIQNRDQRAEKKQIQKVRRAEKERLAEIQSQRSARINKERNRFNTQVVSIRASFSAQIATSQNSIQRLRRQLRRTNNPFQREVILANINTLQTNIVRLRGQQRSRLRQASAAYQQNILSLRKTYTLRLAAARNRYDDLVAEVQTAWKKIYKSDVRAAQANRQRQFQLVTSLRQQGDAAIAAIPDLLS